MRCLGPSRPCLLSLVGLAAVVVVSLWAPRAGAQPAAPLTLRFESDGAPRACPGEDRLRDEVKERLGYDPFREHAEREVVVRLSRRGDDVIARIALSRRGLPGGARELSSSAARCEELVEATALALSIAVEGTREPAPLPPPPIDERPPDDGTAPGGGRRLVITSEWEPPPPPLVDDTRRLSFELSLGGAAGLGAGPGSLLGLTLGAAARSGPLALHLEASLEAPGEVSVGERSHLSGGLYALAFQPCLRLWAGRLIAGRAAWAGGCGSVALGAFVAGSEGLDRGRLVLSPWVGLGARGTLDVALLHWLSLRLYGDVLAPMTRISLSDPSTGEPLWISPLLSARGGLMAVVYLP